MINSFPENSDRTYSGVPIPSSVGTEVDHFLRHIGTVTANGTAVSFRNENRNAPDTFAGTFYKGSTVTVDGTQLQHNLISGSKTTGGSAKGDEVVLKANTNYVLKYVNSNVQDDKISFDIVFLDIV